MSKLPLSFIEHRPFKLYKLIYRYKLYQNPPNFSFKMSYFPIDKSIKHLKIVEVQSYYDCENTNNVSYYYYDYYFLRNQ